jgi:hypothetical protein
MTPASPHFDLWESPNWRTTSHSAQAVAQNCRPVSYNSSFDLDIVAGSNLNRLLLRGEPTVRLSYDAVRALVDAPDAKIFEQGSFRYKTAIKPLRDAFLDEFQFALSNNMGGDPGRGRFTVANELAHIALSRRSVGRALDGLLDIFRSDAQLGDEPIVWWFRTRVREVISRVRLTIRFRCGVEAKTQSHAQTLREWAPLFAIHTGFSPPTKRIAISSPFHGGYNESNRRPDARPYFHAWRRPQHPSGPGFGSTLENLPTACRPELVDDRRFHQRSALGRWPLRRADRRGLGGQLRLGLRHQPGLRAPVAANVR